MARTLSQVIDALPKGRQAKINIRYLQLKDEVESLAALRKAAGKAQVELASTMGVSQPAISKIEKQADMYLSTLRQYVRALGGDLQLVVKLPSHKALTLHGVGEIGLYPVLKTPTKPQKRSA